MNEFKNIPLPSTAVSTTDKSDDITIADVIKSIKNIVVFATFRSKINKILDSLVEYGIDLTAINNPEQLMRQLIKIKSKGSKQNNISIEKIDDMISDLAEFASIKLSDIDKSIRIIQRYNSIARGVDTMIRSVSRSAVSEDAIMNFAKSILGIDSKRETEDIDIELKKPTREEAEEIKRILKEL